MKTKPAIKKAITPAKTKPDGLTTLPKDANIHAKECQLYLPSKELLKQKLEEWSAAASR